MQSHIKEQKIKTDQNRDVLISKLASKEIRRKEAVRLGDQQ